MRIQKFNKNGSPAKKRGRKGKAYLEEQARQKELQFKGGQEGEQLSAVVPDQILEEPERDIPLEKPVVSSSDGYSATSEASDNMGEQEQGPLPMVTPDRILEEPEGILLLDKPVASSPGGYSATREGEDHEVVADLVKPLKKKGARTIRTPLRQLEDLTDGKGQIGQEETNLAPRLSPGTGGGLPGPTQVSPGNLKAAVQPVNSKTLKDKKDKGEGSPSGGKESPLLVLGPDGTYDVPESQRRKPQVLVQTIAVLNKISTEFLVDIHYHRITKGWYEWNGSYWKHMEEYEVRGRFDVYCTSIFYLVIKHDTLRELNQFRSDYYAETVCQCDMVEMFSPPSLGVVFSNGFFSENSMSLEAHNKKKYHTHGLPFAYPRQPDIRSLPDVELLSVLNLFFRDHQACCLYRTLGYRVCVPRGDLQTGYILHGPNGSGKGVTISFLQRLFPASTIKSITLSELTVSFNRSALVDAKVLVINEVTELKGQAISMINQMLGNDVYSSTKKYANQLDNVRFEGTIVLATNLEPASLFTNQPALVDRFLVIGYKGRQGNPNPLLPKVLQSKAPQLINWFMSVERDVLKKIVRTGDINQELMKESLDGIKRKILEQTYSMGIKGLEPSQSFKLTDFHVFFLFEK